MAYFKNHDSNLKGMHSSPFYFVPYSPVELQLWSETLMLLCSISFKSCSNQGRHQLVKCGVSWPHERWQYYEYCGVIFLIRQWMTVWNVFDPMNKAGEQHNFSLHPPKDLFVYISANRAHIIRLSLISLAANCIWLQNLGLYRNWLRISVWSTARVL